jgi:hypothetical protein
LFIDNRTPIARRSKLQKTMVLSTAEAVLEYYAVSRHAVKVSFHCCLLNFTGFAPTAYTPVYEVNNACIEWSKSIIGGQERAKHIDMHKNFAHKAIQNGHLRLILLPRRSSWWISPPRASIQESPDHGKLAAR